MPKKKNAKRILDFLMLLAMPVLMAYSLVGAAFHEWLGIGTFVLFLLHHILNWRWCRSIFRGKYTWLRIWQTSLVLFVLAAMLGSMVSGVILSRYAFAALPIRGGSAFARPLHMLSSYWGFLFLSLHLGFHWSAVVGAARNAIGTPSALRTWGLRILALTLACYGIAAFFRRGIGDYLLLKIQFVFFDFREPLIFFLMDYLAVMALFTLIGHSITEMIKHCRQKRKAV